ncbi:MAG: DUF2066 domain-containing protein [Alphaproteobacteria bacterium]
MAIIYKTFYPARTVFYTLFACFLLGMAPVLAADDLFTVEGVKVDVTAASALAARDQAFDKAQVDAFTALAGRMLSESDLAKFKAPDAGTVSGMVQDYEVTAEKLSSVRYIGTYTFTFRQAAVERYFNKAGASYTNIASAPLLVLPFYQLSGKSYLWSPMNVWMQAWNRSGGQTGLVPVILPIGDLEDVGDIGDDDVFSYNPERLSSMLARYGAGDAVLVVAVPSGLSVRAGENDLVAGGAVTVSLYRTDQGQPEHVQEMVVEAMPGETLTKLLDRAAIEAQKKLHQNWKDKTVVPAAYQEPEGVTIPNEAMSGNRLVARVRIQSLEDWATVQRSLGRVRALSATSLKSLTPREAMVELSFRGDEQMLRYALAQAGMNLSQPQYAQGGYTGAPESSRLVYDLSLSPPPVQPSSQFRSSPYQAPGSYQSPVQAGQQGYSGQF